MNPHAELVREIDGKPDNYQKVKNSKAVYLPN